MRAIIICTRHKYYKSDKIKEDEMEGTCSMHRDEKYIQTISLNA
jgi:hypothetical protein